MIPILHLPGEMMPGTIRPDQARYFCPLRNVVARIMSNVGMPSVMQTISSIPASAASMIGIGRKRRRNEDHGCVGAGFAACLIDAVENVDAFVFDSAFARRDSADNLRSIVHGLQRREMFLLCR